MRKWLIGGLVLVAVAAGVFLRVRGEQEQQAKLGADRGHLRVCRRLQEGQLEPRRPAGASADGTWALAQQGLPVEEGGEPGGSLEDLNWQVLDPGETCQGCYEL